MTSPARILLEAKTSGHTGDLPSCHKQCEAVESSKRLKNMDRFLTHNVIIRMRYFGEMKFKDQK